MCEARGSTPTRWAILSLTRLPTSAPGPTAFTSELTRARIAGYREQRTGALYGVLPPDETKKVLHDPGKWNAGKIRVQGAHVEHWLNGEKVLEYDLASRPLQEAVKQAVIKLPAGYGMYKFKTALVILDDGDEIALRGLKVRPLPPAAPAR